MNLLLDNGAIVRGVLMDAAICWGDTALVEKLMSKISPSAHKDRFYALLTDAAKHLRNDIGYKFIRQIMQACWDTHNNKCIRTNQRFLVHAMFNAARRNNIDLIKLLFPHAGQQGLDSALTAAAQFGSHSLVSWLIAHGARVNGRGYVHDTCITTPLAEAIRRDDALLVALLAKDGAWDQIGEPSRLNAVMRAVAESGNLAYLLKVLQLVPNPSPHALSYALILAIRARHEEVALKLLEAGADTTTQGLALFEALRIQSQSLTWAILESDMGIEDTMDEEVLDTAIKWGDLKIVEALFFMGAGVNNYSGPPPLSIAIKAGNRPLIDLMINLGADLNINHAWQRSRTLETYTFADYDSQGYSSPLAAATLVRDSGTVNYLLDRGADPADEEAILNAIAHDRTSLNHILQSFCQRYPQGRAGFGGVVLLYGLHKHDEEALDLCLRAGFDVNSMARDQEYGRTTPLGLAIKKHQSCLEWISKFLDAGGNANLLASVKEEPRPNLRKDITVRQTAFLDAIETRNLALVELLISKGADVRKEARLGLKRTPLQKACEVGSHTIVDLLLAHNADVNEAPAACGGATALQLAAKAGSTRIAKTLLDLGAKVDAPGVRIRGRSAMEFAAEYGRLDMISFLFNAAGGRVTPDQYTSAVALAQENGHLVCADLLTELLTRSQVFLDASRIADDGGRANVVG